MNHRTTMRVCFLALITALFVSGPEARGQATAKPWPQQAVRGAKAMVATDEELGSQAGLEILKAGGNAVDAGVAVALALAGAGTGGRKNCGRGGTVVGAPHRVR